MRPADKRGVKITHIERLTNSRNGNPRFQITFDDGSTHQTQADASIGYSITNSEFRGLVNVWLTRAGRIEYATPADDR